MKALKTFFYTLLIFSSSMFAQNGYYNNGYNNNSVTRFGGVDRTIANDYSSRAKKTTPEEIEKDRNERIDEYMIKLKNELNLDELQFIVIKKELISNSKNVDIVMKKENSQEDKTNEIKALMDKTEVVINSYLNKDQKEKYLLFKANMNDKKKKDKKDKSLELNQN